MKVYISSTYNDLKDYREAVANVLRKLGHDVLGMENYVAESARPVEVCQQDAIKCDVYILLLGWRYGFVPSNPTISGEGDTGLTFPPSITALEYGAALGESEKGKVEILPFLVDPAAAWPAQFMDAITKEQDSSRINSFRRRVSENHIIATFSNPDELAREVAAAMKRVEASVTLTKRPLLSADRARFETMSKEEQMSSTAIDEIAQEITKHVESEILPVDIGKGNTWWSTRLYLLISLAADLTSIRQILITGPKETIIGLCTPAIMRDKLLQQFPILAGYEEKLGNKRRIDTHDETVRRLNVWTNYFANEPAETPEKPSKQKSKSKKKPVIEKDVRVWVRQGLIKSWLGEYLIQGGIVIDERIGFTMGQVQQILDWPWPYVPVSGLKNPKSGEPDYPIVVNRNAFALGLAREWVAREMPRNPAR